MRRSFCVALILLGVGVSAASTVPPAPVPGFWLTGLAPDSSFGWVTSLTKNGETAGGYSASAIPISASSFTWTQAGGRNDFGLLPGMTPVNSAFGRSDNGVVVGNMRLEGNFQKSRAYRWLGTGPLQDLGVPTGTSRSFGTGVSGNGNVVVGYGESGSMGGFAGQAFRWTPDKGMQGLGYLKPMSIRSQANGVSRDGTTIVGRNMDFNLTDEAFVWTETGGMKALPNLPNALLSAEARAVNADGSVVVGESISSNGSYHAVRWKTSGVEDLSIGSNFGSSYAFAVSDDGDVIGGTTGTSAFIWTPNSKMMLAIDYLALCGVTVPSDYVLTYVYAISGDGLTFGGAAENVLTNKTEGWVATVPSASHCVPDCDDSGQLNIDDFICFQTFFALGEPKSDCDESGSLNIDDFVCFQTFFVLGC